MRKRVARRIPKSWTAILLATACQSSPTPSAPYRVEMLASDYQWEFRHAGRDGQLHTRDDIVEHESLNVPAQRRLVVDLVSKDYVYFVEIDDWGIREMAVPDIDSGFEVFSGDSAVHSMRGDQMCGFAHLSLHRKLFVQ